MTPKRLGRGLENLIPDVAPEVKTQEAGIATLKISQIFPNPSQPRKQFDESELQELSESIRESGLLQPIVVRPSSSGYQILAGERRYRAAKMVGMNEIPAVIRNATDQEAAILSLVENLQRADLNPIEKAEGIRSILEKNKITQEQAAKQLGKDRSHIANLVRLLDLPIDIKDLVSRGTLSMGHARAILGINDPGVQRKLADLSIKKNMSVRGIEKLVQSLKSGSEWVERRKKVDKPANIKELEDRISAAVGLRVEINERRKGRGIVSIHFSSMVEFEAISDKLSR
ncbi:MAG: ParB/RepB/Spo0J family partition protein [Planctomycetota bacterium]